MDISLALLTAIDIPIVECKLVAHQPTITEISYLGENTFFTGVQTLCLYKTMFARDNVDLDNISNFQIFMMIMKEKETADKKKAVIETLKLFFPNYTVTTTPNSLLFLKGSETSMIDENNFEALQNVLREIACLNSGPMDKQTFNPIDEQAKAIADKIMEGRAKIAKEKNKDGANVFVQYISILAIALHISLLELRNCTLFQFYDLVERYCLWVNWDIDLRLRLAGGKPDNNPENWMKNIH